MISANVNMLMHDPSWRGRGPVTAGPPDLESFGIRKKFSKTFYDHLSFIYFQLQ